MVNHIKKFKKRLITSLILLFLFFLPPILVSSYQDEIYFEAQGVPEAEVAIVFGAGVKTNGQPSDVLKDRLKTAAALYKEGKVEKILVSGDNRFENYNEPEAMYNYLVGTSGVAKEDVMQDFAGRRTFDTCIRAKEIWGIEKAILVTQEFHLKRAIFTCEGVGVESVGMSATLQPYMKDEQFQLRERMAVYKAFFDVYIWTPEYLGGEQG